MTNTVSLSEFKEWLGVAQSDDTDDFEFETSLAAATQWINNYTGRTFTIDAADVTRVYYPDAQGMVDVLDLVSVTTLKTDTSGNRTYATTLESTEYELLPTNGPRYDRIRIWLTSSQSFGQKRLVQIVGKFGFVENGAPPPAVKLACMILASRYKSRKDAPFGILGSTDIGQFERISKEDPDVISLLTPYRSSAASGSGAGSGSWIMV